MDISPWNSPRISPKFRIFSEHLGSKNPWKFSLIFSADYFSEVIRHFLQISEEIMFILHNYLFYFVHKYMHASTCISLYHIKNVFARLSISNLHVDHTTRYPSIEVHNRILTKHTEIYFVYKHISYICTATIKWFCYTWHLQSSGGSCTSSYQELA